MVDDWIGLAKVKILQGDLQNARKFVEQVMNYIQENPRLYGADPMRTYRFTWDVWLELGEMAKADQALTLAAALIQDYLDKNPDPDVQAMYLRQPHHAVLWAAWRDKKAG